jgi:hypothetical protein
VNSEGLPPRTGSTQASWGRTGDPDGKVQARKRRRVAALAFSAVALVGIAGVVAFVFVQPQAGAERPSAPAAAAAAQPGEGVAPAAERGTQPVAAQKPSAAAASPEVTPIAAEATAVAVLDAGAPAKPKTRIAAAPVRPPVRAPRSRTAPAEAPADAQKKAAQGSITDFGGRR